MARNVKYLDDLPFSGGFFSFVGQFGLDYLLSFKELSVSRAISATLADGNHTIAGASSSDGSSATLTFGYGATDVWLAGAGAWSDAKITGGDGDHAVLIENVALSGAQIKLGSGNSIVQLGTIIGDTRTTITGGDGDFRVKASDLRSVALGDGDHLVTVAKAASVTVGDGNSYVSFKTGYGASNTSILAGDGNHSLVGASLAATSQTTSISFGDGVNGAGSILQLDGQHGTVNVTGGNGDHVVQIEEMLKGKISLGHLQLSDLGHDVTVNIAEVTSQSGVQLALGGGDHRVHVGTHAKDYMTSVSAGDGDSEVEIGVAKLVELGDGNHIIDAGDVSTITVGHGNAQIGFEATNVNFSNRITAGDGGHTIIGTSTSTKASTTNVKVGDGDITGEGSYIHLAGWHSSATVTAGDGDHTVTVDSTKMGRVTLGQGNHVVDVTAEGTSSSAFINIGDGNTELTVSGTGHVTMGAGNHVIAAHDVTSIRTGAGEQHIYFEDGLNFSSTAIYAMGGGDDVVVGIGLDERPRANVQTYDGDDTIVLLNGNWSGTNVGGGAGFDTLYVDERAKNSLFLNGIEKVVYLSSDLSIEEALNISGVSHPDYETGEETIPTSGPLGSADLVALPRDITVQPIEWIDLERQDFDLVALPDPESPAGAELAYVDKTGVKTQSDSGEEFDPASREDRLMEPTSDFFQRAEAYTKSFATDAFDFFYNTVKVNEFGDLSGTNNGEAINDTRGDSQIFAMGGDDVIDGNDGQDRIHGGNGNDIVRGGAGQDLLDGGAGYDVLIGGDDIDIFVFRKGEGTTDIKDFELSFDILDLEGFDDLTYEVLTEAGRQVGTDVFYELGDDTLILRDVELATMVEIDLCVR